MAELSYSACLEHFSLHWHHKHVIQTSANLTYRLSGCNVEMKQRGERSGKFCLGIQIFLVRSTHVVASTLWLHVFTCSYWKSKSETLVVSILTSLGSCAWAEKRAWYTLRMLDFWDFGNFRKVCLLHYPLWDILTFSPWEMPGTDHTLCGRWWRNDKGNKELSTRPSVPAKCYGTWLTQSHPFEVYRSSWTKWCRQLTSERYCFDFKTARRCLRQYNSVV